MNEIRIVAPAKINLGLEITGKRADGFHEICTVLAMLELADCLTVFESDTFVGDDLDGVPAEENLVSRALDAFRGIVPESPSLGWHLIKRVPAAAGLGGASSDAASALMAANALAGSPLSRDELANVACTLGSDISFFLGTPSALATGRGTELTPLSSPKLDVLLIIPDEQLQAKTATMYGALTAEDFSNGDRIERLVARLESQLTPDSELLANAFARPLRSRLPRIDHLQQTLGTLGPYPFGLSGAGPAHFVLAPKESHRAITDTLSSHFGDWLSFISTSTWTESIDLRQLVSD